MKDLVTEIAKALVDIPDEHITECVNLLHKLGNFMAPEESMTAEKLTRRKTVAEAVFNFWKKYEK